MKKKLDVNAFASSLRGESVFFPTKKNEPAPDQAGEPQEPIKEEQPFPPSPLSEVQESNHDTVIPRHHATMQPRQLAWCNVALDSKLIGRVTIDACIHTNHEHTVHTTFSRV